MASHGSSDDLLAQTSSKPDSTQFPSECPLACTKHPSNPTRVKIEPSQVGTQPDGESDTYSRASVNQQQKQNLFRQPILEPTTLG